MPTIVSPDHAYVGYGDYTVQSAVVNVNSATDNDLVIPSTGSKVIYVTACILIAAGAVTVTFKSNSTAICGPMAIAATGGFSVDRHLPNYLCKTAAGEHLHLTLGGAVQVGGQINYIEA